MNLSNVNKSSASQFRFQSKWVWVVTEMIVVSTAPLFQRPRVPKDECERLDRTPVVAWSSSSQGPRKSSQWDGKQFQLNLETVLNPTWNGKFQSGIIPINPNRKY